MTNCEYQNTAGYSFVGNGDSFVASGFRPNYKSYGGKKKGRKSKGHFGVGAHVGLKGVGAHVDTPYTTTGVEVGVGKKSKKKSKVGMAAKVGPVHGRVNVIGGKKKSKKSKGHFGVGAHVGLKGVGAHVDTPYTTTGVEVGVGKSKKSKKKSKVGMAAKVGPVHGRVNVIGGKKKGKKSKGHFGVGAHVGLKGVGAHVDTPYTTTGVEVGVGKSKKSKKKSKVGMGAKVGPVHGRVNVIGGKKKGRKSKGHFGVGAHVGLKGVGAHVDTPYTTTGVEVGVGKSKKSKKKSKVGMGAKVGPVHGRVNVIGGKKKGKKKSKSKSNKRFYKTVRDSMLDMKRSRY